MPTKMKIKKDYNELVEEYHALPPDQKPPTLAAWFADVVWHLRANTVLHTHMLNDLRNLHPEDFRALKSCVDLPNSGIHTNERAPGKVDKFVIQRLAKRGLIHCLDNRFWQLTHLGKMLMIESVGELDGIPLKG